MDNVTIRDIARLSKVSVTTVSRVINDSPNVSDKTRNKVLSVMKLNGYTPNGNAKNLKLKNSTFVSVIVRGFQNPFLNSLVERLQRYIEAAGYQFLVHYIDEHENELAAAKKMVAENKVCAVVLLGGFAAGHEKEFEALGVPCVFATSDIGSAVGGNLFSVCVDEREGAYSAVKYLIKNGHTDIAIAGGVLEADNNVGLRYKGAVEAMSESGIDFKQSDYIVTGFALESSYLAVKEALNRPQSSFTAIFAMSDMVALTCIRAANESGYRVPGDISIIGFDGVELARYINPPLATMRQPSDRIASESVRLLMLGLNGHPGERVLLGSQLVEGRTVGRPNKKR